MANCPLGKAKPESHFKLIPTLWSWVTVIRENTLNLNALRHVQNFCPIKYESDQPEIFKAIEEFCCQNIKNTETCPQGLHLKSLPRLPSARL